jgi:hypothetical protein
MEEKKISDIDVNKAIKDLNELQSRPMFVSGLVVTLSENTIYPIADEIKNAIMMIKGVADVKIAPLNQLDECFTKARITKKIKENFNKILDDI